MNNISENSTDSKTGFTFSKNERLCSKKIIDRLFAEGKSVFVFPLKMVYLETGLGTKTPAQAGFAVSKKNFKRAVQRNLIKRRIREVYRLQKPEFYAAMKELQVAVFFFYTSKEIVDYAVIESALKKGLKKLVREIQKQTIDIK
jgi:ribonuclease P protein component